MPGLDRYDPAMLDDDDDFDEMSPGTRAAAEAELRRRDRELGGRRGLEYGMYYTQYVNFCVAYIMWVKYVTDLFWFVDEESEDEGVAPRRKRRMAEKAADGDLEDTEVGSSLVFMSNRGT